MKDIDPATLEYGQCIFLSGDVIGREVIQGVVRAVETRNSKRKIVHVTLSIGEDRAIDPSSILHRIKTLKSLETVKGVKKTKKNRKVSQNSKSKENKLTGKKTHALHRSHQLKTVVLVIN